MCFGSGIKNTLSGNWPLIKSSTRLTIEDVRRAGHCVRGAKAWCEQHEIDFRDFLKNGYPLESVAALKDGYGDQIIARKLARRSSGGE